MRGDGRLADVRRYRWGMTARASALTQHQRRGPAIWQPLEVIQDPTGCWTTRIEGRRRSPSHRDRTETPRGVRIARHDGSSISSPRVQVAECHRRNGNSARSGASASRASAAVPIASGRRLRCSRASAWAWLLRDQRRVLSRVLDPVEPEPAACALSTEPARGGHSSDALDLNTDIGYQNYAGVKLAVQRRAARRV